MKEIFYTLQSEGANAGRPAVFCRFAGCNLWFGREQDRASAICQFCDTDFFGTNGAGGGKFTSPQALAAAVATQWPATSVARAHRFVVCTGGGPLLQFDEPLVGALHAEGLEIAVETNGTQLPPEGLDWICVSPKSRASLALRRGNELKLVYPQIGVDPAQFEALAFEHFFLQPMDGPSREHNTVLGVEYCLAHPQWRLSLQTHKCLGIPSTGLSGRQFPARHHPTNYEEAHGVLQGVHIRGCASSVPRASGPQMRPTS